MKTKTVLLAPEILNPPSPTILNTITRVIMTVLFPIFMLLAIIGEEGFNFMWASLGVFALFVTWLIKKTNADIRETEDYTIYLVDKAMYKAFFKKGSFNNIPLEKRLKFGNARSFYIDNFVEKAMEFYDHPDFNKTAYMQYQLQKVPDETI